jgi:hypothetical protein
MLGKLSEDDSTSKTSSGADPSSSSSSSSRPTTTDRRSFEGAAGRLRPLGGRACLPRICVQIPPLLIDDQIECEMSSPLPASLDVSTEVGLASIASWSGWRVCSRSPSWSTASQSSRSLHTLHSVWPGFVLLVIHYCLQLLRFSCQVIFLFPPVFLLCFPHLVHSASLSVSFANALRYRHLRFRF